MAAMAPVDDRYVGLMAAALLSPQPQLFKGANHAVRATCGLVGAVAQGVPSTATPLPHTAT
jgi:hypothetical protein